MSGRQTNLNAYDLLTARVAELDLGEKSNLI